MTPRVGQPISVAQINTELGRSATAAFFFNDQEAGWLSGDGSLAQPTMSRWWSAAKVTFTPGFNGLTSTAGYAIAGYQGGPFGSLTQNSFGGVPLYGLTGPWNSPPDVMQPPAAIAFTSGACPTPYSLSVRDSGVLTRYTNPSQYDTGRWQFLTGGTNLICGVPYSQFYLKFST